MTNLVEISNVVKTIQQTMSRRYALSWLVFLKELHISQECHKAREGLLQLLTSNYISEEISSYFTGVNQINIDIPLESDPTQIASIKKILHALKYVENIFKNIENIPIDEERYTLGIIKNAVSIIWHASNEAFTVLESLNQTTPDLQAILSPYVTTLFSKTSLALDKMQAFTPENPARQSSNLFQQTLNFLPSQKEPKPNGLSQVGRFLEELPGYFKWMKHTLFDDSTTGHPTEKALITSYKKQEIEKQLQNMADAEWSLFPNYISTLRLLASQGIELLNEGAPLTKEAYKAAVKKLNAMRYELIPSMLAEIERMEETVGLQPGVLSDAMTVQMSSFYTMLARQVNQIGIAAKVIDDSVQGLSQPLKEFTRKMLISANPIQVGPPLQPEAHLDVLIDSAFLEKLQQAQLERKKYFPAVDAELTQNELRAANQFFNKLGQYYSWYYKGNLAHLPSADRALLLEDYEVFQKHFASKHPDIACLIENALQPSKSVEGSRLSFLYSMPSDFKTLWSDNHFTRVLACRTSVITEIKQNALQSDLNHRLMNKSLNHHQHRLSDAATRFFALIAQGNLGALSPEKKQQLFDDYQWIKIHVQSQFPEIDELVSQAIATQELKWTTTETDLIMSSQNTVMGKIKDTESAFMREAKQAIITPVGTPHVYEKKSFFQQLHECHLSQKLDNFVQKTLRPYLEDNLDPILLEQIGEPPFTEFYRTSPEATMYRRVFQALYLLSESLKKLESIHEKGTPSNLLSQGRYFITLNNAIFIDIMKAKYILLEATEMPGLQPILNDAFELLRPMNHLPIIGPWLSSPRVSQSRAPVDFVKEWEAQQAIVRHHVEGISKDSPHSMDISANTQTQNTTQTSVPSAVTQTNVGTSESVLAQISTYLYQLPSIIKELRLKKIDPKTLTQEGIIHDEAIERTLIEEDEAFKRADLEWQAKELIELLNNLSYGPSSLKKVLIAIKSIFDQLHVVGKTSREKIIELLKDLRQTLGTDMISLSDTAEFNLGFKPDTFSARLTWKVNDFYKSLLDSIPNLTSQEKIALSVDTTPTQQRILLEEKRLAALQQEHPAQRLNEKIFTSSPGHWAIFNRLKEWELFQQESQFNPFKYMNDQREFIQCYGELEPYLREIDPYLHRAYVLIELQTPEDFSAKLSEIIALEPKIREYIKVQEASHQEKVSRAQERIHYLKQLLEIEETKAAQEELKFKKECLAHYFNHVITKKFENELGSYAQPFLENLQTQYEVEESILFDGLSLDQNIEDILHQRMEATLGSIHNRTLISLYTSLNRKQKELEALIQQSEEENHPLFIEKRELLNHALMELKQLPNFPLPDQVEQQLNSINDVIKTATVFDLLHHGLNNLNEMEVLVNDYDDEELRQEKMEKIQNMKKIILSDKNPIERITTLKKEALSHGFKDIMLKNADSLLIKKLKQFWSWLTGWKRPEKVLFHEFKQRLFFTPPEPVIKPENVELEPSSHLKENK